MLAARHEVKMTYIDLQKRLAETIKRNHKFSSTNIINNRIDLESICVQEIDFDAFVRNYAERWSISSDDFYVFNTILPIENTKILELGRMFGLSTAAFCCNHNIDMTSIDDNSCDIHSFERLDFFNISEFLLNAEYKTKSISTITLKHSFIDKIAKQFLEQYCVYYIDDKFSPKYLNQKYDFIFEDLVWNKDTMPILDSCIKYLDSYPDCVLIVHDDRRFPIVHERIKNFTYSYTSDYFRKEYNISPNLALVSKRKLPFLP